MRKDAKPSKSRFAVQEIWIKANQALTERDEIFQRNLAFQGGPARP
jgi:hypothetical protein